MTMILLSLLQDYRTHSYIVDFENYAIQDFTTKELCEDDFYEEWDC
jgi:hypothetical protein